MKLTAVVAFGAALITLPVAAHAQEVAAEPAVAESVAADPAETDAVTAEPAVAVAQDVAVDGHVVIPRGTRAVGEITWRTGKGAFGKSGKMEMAIRSGLKRRKRAALL